MRTKRKDQKLRTNNYKKGMELVQVALLVSIAIGLALIFRTQKIGRASVGKEC